MISMLKKLNLFHFTRQLLAEIYAASIFSTAITLVVVTL